MDVLDSGDAAHLALLQRPELGITFTKIHCWNLTQFEKCVFLDADTLVVQNCDELFEREELSAAPDVGWPDCFNSGVFVYKPSAETFQKLIQFAQERGSFDGGDQGLLNSFFSDWARGDISKHLPFLYNVTSAAFYSYLPALKHYGQDLKIIHFIGAAKPWLQHFNFETRTVDAPDHIRGLLQLWWDIFVGQVHSNLDSSMTGVAGNLARVVAGGPHEALDDLTRRQGWESGNIDYMGADSFDKIWAKISQTLSQPRTSPSPPKEVSPPVQAPEPVKEAASAPVEAVLVQAPVIPDVSKTETVSKPAPVAAPTPVAAPAPVAEPTPAVQPAPVSEPALVPAAAEPAPVKQPSPVPEPIAPAVPEVPKVAPAVPAPVALDEIPVTVIEESKTESVPTGTKTEDIPVASDSPPLASTPSEEAAVPAAKSTEEAAQETRL